MTTGNATVNHIDARRNSLNERQLRFAESYAKHGNGVRAYREAGYSLGKTGEVTQNTHRMVYQVLHNAKVSAAIERIKNREQVKLANAQRFTVDWVRDQHAELLDTSKSADDLTNATRNLEGIGRTIGAYQDNNTINIERAIVFSQAEAIEARRLAAILIQGGGASVDPGASEHGLHPVLDGSATELEPEPASAQDDDRNVGDDDASQ